ncbi:MAG: flavodoxin family protein [Thermoproteota archaeon]|nr:MAG: flavodoxin family protein [Candidatus Korarchaeota archaeon]
MRHRSLLIAGMSGSPRPGKNTEVLLKESLRGAEEEGVETTLIRLADYRIEPCSGCGTCLKGKPCPIDERDDMPKLAEAILGAQGVIICAPSYWGAVPGILKNFMDRTRPLKMAGNKLAGKVLAAMAVAGLRCGGGEFVVDSILRFGLAHGMIIVGNLGDPTSSPCMVVSSLQGEKGWRRAVDDEMALSWARELGARVGRVVKALASAGLL